MIKFINAMVLAITLAVGSIVKRSNGRWYADIEIEPGPDGKRRRKPLGGFATKAAATDAVAQARVERRDGMLVPTSKMSYAEWAALREESQRSEVRPRSVAIYAMQRKNHLIPSIGRYALQKLTPSLCRQATRRERLSLRTQRGLHALLSSDLEAAVREGILAVNPMRRVKAPSAALAKERSLQMTPYSAAEAAQVLRLLDGNRYRTFVALSLWQGWRRSEACGITWDRIDLEEATILIDRQWDGKAFAPTKSGRPRTIELDDEAVALLRSWKRQRTEEELALGRHLDPTSHVFAHAEGSPWSPDAVSHAWRRLQNRKGWQLAPRRLHDLRHTCATLALQAGENPVATAALLGHDVKMLLDVYGHCLKGDQRKVAASVASAIRAAG
jgi:integrase